MSSSERAAALYAARTFDEFWAAYVRMHARPETQAMHAAATLAAIALTAWGVAARRPALVALAPVADHAIAQLSHRIFEGNATSPWRRPTWHARAELRMARLVLTGRMAAEVARRRA